MEKLKIKYPVAVEGKYDREKVLSVADATVISLDGFGIFNNSQKLELLRKICGDGKLLLLTDSDRAGGFIRSKLKGFLPPESVVNVYVPRLEGKEKRKKSPSKEGVLGVEGLDGQTVYHALKPFSGECTQKASITKQDMYALGLSGGQNSACKRNRVASLLGLPEKLTPKAFLSAINLCCTAEELAKALEEIQDT